MVSDPSAGLLQGQHLFAFFLVEISLQRGEMIDEQHAVEVVDLILENHGEPIFGDQMTDGSVLGLVIDGTLFIALQLRGEFRYAQTAFLIQLGAFVVDNFRVDQSQVFFFFTRFGDIDDNYP